MSPSTPQPDRQPDGQIVLDAPVTLPDILDVLIVGGGPLGTGCAFRAKELGLAALVVDMDDVMKRIRDYDRGKLIHPDYGDGDTLRFPGGGELTLALRFLAIDKDSLVDRWKGLYRRYNVPAQVGVELLRIELQADGVWRAEVYNQNTKRNGVLLARSIVLGLGRGVPRRLDIPGNVQGLALRLNDASRYVGATACVIGGGTSAAEAVIAISNAKAASEADRSPVYWSYRGRFMPKVSQALAPDLFDVMMNNGNLRFILESEPIAIASRDDGEFLSIRTAPDDRPGVPRVELEFAKASCVACIGADRPDALLKQLGADFVPNETGVGDRLVVSPLLETRRPGLFLAGDLLSDDFAETADFDGHPSSFAIRPRRGNIKAALRDGVLIAEVVKQRLAGVKDIRVVLTNAPDLAGAEEPVTDPPSPLPGGKPSSPGRLIELLADGTTSAQAVWLVANGITTIGRAGATVTFPNDSMLSDQHAAISHGPAGLELRDLASKHGVFLKLAEGRVVTLTSGMVIKAGRQWLVVKDGSGGATVVHHDDAGTEVKRYRVAEATTLVLGRKLPATILDAADSTLSRRHLSLSSERGQLQVRDLGSSNGTYIKVDTRWPLADGDVIWLGNQLLRLEVGGTERSSGPEVITGTAADPPVAPPPGPAPQPPAVAPGGGEPVVTFGPGKTYPFGKSSTLLDLALGKRVRIKYDCKVGDCGKCRVIVTSGAQNLDPKLDRETKALRMNGHPEAECRLACLVKSVTGPVVVEIPK